MGARASRGPLRKIVVHFDRDQIESAHYFAKRVGSPYPGIANTCWSGICDRRLFRASNDVNITDRTRRVNGLTWIRRAAKSWGSREERLASLEVLKKF